MVISRWTVQAVAVVACLLIPACAVVPQERFAAFVESVGATGEAGRRIYTELDIAVATAQGRTAAPGLRCPGERPTCFEPDDHLPRPARATTPEIEARILAIDLVSAYTDALFAMTSGATQAALGEKIDRYATAVNGTGRLLGGDRLAIATDVLGSVAIGAIRNLATTIEGLRAGQAASDALIAGAPLIDQIIAALIEDTPAAFDLYSGSQGVIAARASGADRVAAIENIRAYHASLAAFVVLLAGMEDNHDALIAAIEADIPALDRYEVALDQALGLRAALEEFDDAMADIEN